MKFRSPSNSQINQLRKCERSYIALDVRKKLWAEILIVSSNMQRIAVYDVLSKVKSYNALTESC